MYRQLRVFLVRHGESESNLDVSMVRHKADHAVALSPAGLTQADEAGRRLAMRLPSPGSYSIRLWNSPYLRTRQTADRIAAQLYGANIAVERAESIMLCEQQFGLFDGIADEDLPKEFPKEHADYKKWMDYEGRFFARMPMGESRFDVACRVHQFFDTLHRDAEQTGIRDVVVVAHGVTLRAFTMMWMHHPYEWFEKEPNPANASIRLLEERSDEGYIFPGFRSAPTQSQDRRNGAGGVTPGAAA